MGSWSLEAPNGGAGILLSGVSGVAPGRVLVLGAGTVGKNAIRVAMGIGARVVVIDRDPNKLRYLDDIYHGRLVTLVANIATIEYELEHADLVIGAVLLPGAKAPRIIKRDHLKRMKPGSVIVDVSIDQGGIAETSKATTHENPTYVVDGVVHYCVANMPGAVPKTSTAALTNATLPYVLELADLAPLQAAKRSPALARGFNTHRGALTHPGVAEAFGLSLGHLPLDEVELSGSVRKRIDRRGSPAVTLGKSLDRTPRDRTELVSEQSHDFARVDSASRRVERRPDH
jgi:alanine dehydrogenase